jgi:hypothetical protein
MKRGRHQSRRRGLIKVWLVIFCTICAVGRVSCVAPQEIDLNAQTREGDQVEAITVEAPPIEAPPIEAPRAEVLKPGPARFETLISYFEAANRDLFSHFESIQKLRAKREAHSGISYVAGASGVGKSFVVRHAGMFDKAVTETVKLSTMFTETRPDLQTLDGKRVFNQLPSATAFDVQGLVDAMGPEKVFVLIDDLDEVHERTAVVILKALETYVATPRAGFKHFFVFGRPESFWPWLRDSTQVTRPQVTHIPLTLQGPEYQTSGDIAFRCQDYYGFKFSKPAPPSVINDLTSQINRFPFLRDTMRPLFAGNLVIEASVARCETGTTLLNTADALKLRLFDQLLARNQKSHGRPGADSALYRNLLQQAASLPQTHNRALDRQGFFTVFETDALSFTDEQGQVRQVYARDVLNRSGLVTLDVRETRMARYRFEPFWVQAFLANQM